MKVGYSVEGATDRALLTGLKDRWCPDAELVEGVFRGRSQQSLRREISKLCDELGTKGCDVIVILTDSNRLDWKSVLESQIGKVPADVVAKVICGVADRNVECWLCLDADYIGRTTGQSPQRYRIDDPKGVFEGDFQISSLDRKEPVIAKLVQEAPLKVWIERSKSFAAFYDRCRELSLTQSCRLRNERESDR